MGPLKNFGVRLRTKFLHSVFWYAISDVHQCYCVFCRVQSVIHLNLKAPLSHPFTWTCCCLALIGMLLLTKFQGRF